MFLPQTLRQKKVRLFTTTDMILIRTVSETEAQNGYLNRTVDTLIRFTTSTDVGTDEQQPMQINTTF